MNDEEKKGILGQKLDGDELEMVSAGMHSSAEAECPNSSIVGGCTGAYYNERCHATVEAGSSCSYTDFRWEVYTVTPGARAKYAVIDHPNWCTRAILACFLNGHDTTEED